MQKCKFNQASLNYLGHTVSKDGLHPDRVTAVINAPAPRDASSLRSYQGLASWYSKFIPDCATVVEPLRAVLRDSADLNFTWTVEAESGFTALKGLIVNGSAVAPNDPELPTCGTMTYASDYGLGAILTQMHSDQQFLKSHCLPFLFHSHSPYRTKTTWTVLVATTGQTCTLCVNCQFSDKVATADPAPVTTVELPKQTGKFAPNWTYFQWHQKAKRTPK